MGFDDEARRMRNRRASGHCRAERLDEPKGSPLRLRPQSLMPIALPAQSWQPALTALAAALSNGDLTAGWRLAFSSAFARLLMGRPCRLSRRDFLALQHAGRMARGGTNA